MHLCYAPKLRGWFVAHLVHRLDHRHALRLAARDPRRLRMELQHVLRHLHRVPPHVPAGEVDDSQAPRLKLGGDLRDEAAGDVGRARLAHTLEVHVRPRVAHLQGVRRGG
eukprot:1185812-Prorocentrum_minimum.AAC.2